MLEWLFELCLHPWSSLLLIHTLGGNRCWLKHTRFWWNSCIMAPGFSLPQLKLWWALGENQRMDNLCLFLSLWCSNNQIPVHMQTNQRISSYKAEWVHFSHSKWMELRDKELWFPRVLTVSWVDIQRKKSRALTFQTYNQFWFKRFLVASFCGRQSQCESHMCYHLDEENWITAFE